MGPRNKLNKNKKDQVRAQEHYRIEFGSYWHKVVKVSKSGTEDMVGSQREFDLK